MTTKLDPGFAPEPDPAHLPNPLPRNAFPSLELPLNVEAFYASLMRHTSSVEAGLGSRLLYVGELGDRGRAFMVAANISGAASLAATADTVAQKQAIHDGVADFLVTNLDEAIRILKNEIRKREPVAVCVAGPPALVEQEMIERGVLPDLICDHGLAGAADLALSFGGNPTAIRPLDLAADESLLTLSVDEAPAKWLPRLDAIAIECLVSDESLPAQICRRWLRLAPRYLGRFARNFRVLRCPTPAAQAIARRIRASIQSGEIPIPVRIDLIQP